MVDVLEGGGGKGGEQLVAYNIFLTDDFGDGGITNVRGHVFQNEGGSGNADVIDGYRNDDSYRSSRRLLSNSTPEQRSGGLSNLRENSLARQIDEKRDQPAVIRCIRRLKPEELERFDGTESIVPWVNLIPPNTKFFLETVQESRQEKVQIIDTFGEWIAFFFGRRPEIYNYSGTLMNASNHDWKNEFQWNYDNFLRGSQAVKNRATMILQYDDVMVEGYMLNSTTQMTGLSDKSVPFSFSLLVINRSQMNPRRALGLRFQRSGFTAAEGAVFNDLQSALDISEPGSTSELQTFLLMREYFSGNYIPGAGKLVHRGSTNDVQSETSVTPGQKGGSTNEKPVSQSFDSKVSTAVTESGAILLPTVFVTPTSVTVGEVGD
jgi:hypothetical protein